jgi:hypothetical protein
MRLKIIITTIVIVFSLIGCKKDKLEQSITKTTDKDITTSSVNLREAPSSGISLSSDGYLVFDSLHRFNQFLEFLNTNSHSAIQSFLNTYGFESRGQSIYESTEEMLEAGQADDYLFSDIKAIEVEDIIIKISEDSSFMLTMTRGNFNQGAYEQMLNDGYNPNYMNKLATYPEYEDIIQTSFLQFMVESPNGTEQTNFPSASGRRFIGSQNNPQYNTYSGAYYNTGTGSCVVMVSTWHTVSSYFFWIHTGTSAPHFDGAYEQTVDESECD